MWRYETDIDWATVLRPIISVCMQLVNSKAPLERAVQFDFRGSCLQPMLSLSFYWKSRRALKDRKGFFKSNTNVLEKAKEQKQASVDIFRRWSSCVALRPSYTTSKALVREISISNS